MFSEVSSASRTEEEEGGEVRDGRDDRDAAHLYRLVSSALHVFGQICGRSRQQTAGRVGHHHAGRLSGTATRRDASVTITLGGFQVLLLIETRLSITLGGFQVLLLVETCLSPSRWAAFRYCCS